jgi:hypothetical protein
VAYGDWIIQLSMGEQSYRLCRICFQEDGTYSVAAPYHQANAATIFRTLAFSGVERRAILEPSVTRISLEDDENRLKLSHHPDGALELSSPQLPLGDEGNTSFRIQSSPLGNELGAMPTFHCTIHNPTEFSPGDRLAPDTVTFDSSLIAPRIGADAFLLEGAFFPADWREFLIRDDERDWTLRLVKGDRGVISCRALLSLQTCENQGFLGVRVTKVRSQPGRGGGFLLVGIGSKREQDGVEVIDELCCVYPEPPMSTLPRVGEGRKP